MQTHDKLALAQMAGFFQNINAETIHLIDEYYATEASFRDPINEVQGISAIKRVFADLYKQLKNISIVVKEMHGDENAGCLVWQMRYQFRGRARSIPGVSHFHFDTSGKVKSQEDFWDASFVLYGEFPFLGWMMRGIKKMARVKG
jgi:steroid Delta-isomerase